MQNVKGTADYYGKEQMMRSRIRRQMQDVFERYDYMGMDTAILNELPLLTAKFSGGEEIVQAEAELMQLAADVFSELGLQVVIRWNNRRFLSEWLQAAGVPVESSAEAMLTIDKLAKAGIGAVRAELLDIGMTPGAADAILSDLTTAGKAASVGSSLNSFEYLCSQYGISQCPGAQEVRALQSLLTAIGLDGCCSFDPSLTRGLSFYTGTVYEAFDASGSYSSSLCRGGRYDSIIGQLAGNLDSDYPTAGLSFGLEPIMELLRDRMDLPAAAPVTVIPIGSATAEAMQAAAALRSSGIRTRLSPAGRKLHKALASASADGTPLVVLVGEEEAAAGTVRLTEMATMTESVLDIEETIYRIERLLSLPYR